MHDQQTTCAALRELERTWAKAETRADPRTLDAISIGDFRLVGPLGFVLNKQQWLERYRSGDLVTHSLSFEDPVTRVYGDAAMTIARHVQRASYRGQPADGEFRTTHVAVHEKDGWLLAGIQLSPIGGPPPFAPPAEQRAGEGAAPTPGDRR